MQIIKVNETAYQVKINNKLEMVFNAKDEKEALQKAQKYIKRKKR